jgi:S1-C subfamily serine protease
MIKELLGRIIKITFTFLIILTMIGVIQLKIDLNKFTEIFKQEIEILNDRYNQSVENDIELLQELQEQIEKNNTGDNELLKKITNLLSTIDELKRNNVDIDKLLNSDVFVMSIFGEGAGTVIKKTENNMYILTCAHVVKEIYEFNKQGLKFGVSIGYSKSDKRDIIAGMIVYGAEIIKYDEENDLALLKTFIVDDNLIAINITNTEPQKGDIVYSVGSPLGLLRTISKGILSNKIEGFYVSDNTITFGNSGGGLYNINGELIGVPARVLAYDNNSPESSLGLSINLQIIKDFLRGEL